MGEQLIFACLSTAGFAILYHISARHMVLSSLGGFLSWGCYLLCGSVTDNLFYRVLLVSVVTSAYAEIMAKRRRAPATLFLVPGLIPLVPGSYLYYMMLSLVQHDLMGALEYALLTAQWAIALAAGISLAAAARQIIQGVRRRRTGFSG